MPKGGILFVPESSMSGPVEEGRAVRFSFTTPFIVPMSLKCICGFSLGGANQQNNRQKMMHRKFHLNVRKELYCVSDRMLEQVAQEVVEFFIGGVQELSGCNPVPWSSE